MARQKLSSGAKIGLLCALLSTMLTAGVVGVVVYLLVKPAPPREPLRARLDPAGPYLILASRRAAEHYAAAIAGAKNLHPDASESAFDPDDLDGARRVLREQQPRYALVFVEPDELDVNFAWRWLALTTELDDDPLVDVRTGFITGATPEAAAAFVSRIAAAARGDAPLPGVFVDDLGPNPQAPPQAFYESPGAFTIPALGERLTARSLSHGAVAFDDRRLASLGGAGLLHFGGHGHPDRVDDGVTGAQVRRAPLAPCVVFSGACYTGVTRRWYDPFTSAKVEAHTVEPADSFCLNLLQTQAVAYLAALHVDHGMPVYQEMECLACRGASLGDVIKATHDGVILGSGGRVPRFEPFVGGAPAPRRTPTETMLEGTASRVLFGDPALVVTDPFTAPAYRVAVEEEGDSLPVTATLDNPRLTSSYTDTYHADLARNPDQFNDRALIAAALPAGWTGVGTVEVIAVEAGGRPLEHRLVGHAVESDAGRRVLHVQVDVPTTGVMQSPFRVAGATVRLRAVR
jgi:hypothetical protein